MSNHSSSFRCARTYSVWFKSFLFTSALRRPVSDNMRILLRGAGQNNVCVYQQTDRVQIITDWKINLSSFLANNNFSLSINNSPFSIRLFFSNSALVMCPHAGFTSAPQVDGYWDHVLSEIMCLVRSCSTISILKNFSAVVTARYSSNARFATASSRANRLISAGHSTNQWYLSLLRSHQVTLHSTTFHHRVVNNNNRLLHQHHLPHQSNFGGHSDNMPHWLQDCKCFSIFLQTASSIFANRLCFRDIGFMLVSMNIGLLECI